MDAPEKAEQLEDCCWLLTLRSKKQRLQGTGTSGSRRALQADDPHFHALRGPGAGPHWHRLTNWSLIADPIPSSVALGRPSLWELEAKMGAVEDCQCAPARRVWNTW